MLRQDYKICGLVHFRKLKDFAKVLGPLCTILIRLSVLNPINVRNGIRVLNEVWTPVEETCHLRSKYVLGINFFLYTDSTYFRERHYLKEVRVNCLKHDLIRMG